MSINPNQNPDPDQYGGYTGYTPPPQQGQSQTYGQGSYSSYQQPGSQSSYGQQQQQQTYQPPRSASSYSRGSSGSNDPTSTGMKPGNAALLSYLFWWLSGLVFFVIERKNRFVRFSAAQSFLFFGGVTVIYVVLRVLSALPVIGFLLNPILPCAFFVLLVPAVLIWLFLMLQAYRGVSVKLPIIGDYAEGLVERFTKKRTV